MTEAEAREWLDARFPATAIQRLEHYVALLRDEAGRQNLVARSTLDQIWARHIVDSAQLVGLAPAAGLWLDVGSGGGLPGIVVAILRQAPMVMVEPRRKRVEFLEHVIGELSLANATAHGGTLQKIDVEADVISARAVAPMSDLFDWSVGNVSRETVYLLPRGQSWTSELEIARRAWQGRFHVEHSITDPKSGVIVVSGLKRR